MSNNLNLNRLNNINYKLTQNYKMVKWLFVPINNKVVEVKKIDHEKISVNY